MLRIIRTVSRNKKTNVYSSKTKENYNWNIMRQATSSLWQAGSPSDGQDSAGMQTSVPWSQGLATESCPNQHALILFT
jgi:hypothetical protein